MPLEYFNNKLPFNMISNLIKSHKIRDLITSVEDVLKDSSTPFFVKVTKLRNQQADFSVIINGSISIDLVRDLNLKLKSSIGISPGSFIHRSVLPPTEIAPTYLVLSSDYEEFCRNAEQIYIEYCQDGVNFGWIPYIWFENLALIQFIRNNIWQNPYFQKMINSWHVEVGTYWSRE